MTFRKGNREGFGGGGRPAGARNLLTKHVFEDMLRHWSEPAGPGSNALSKGQAALEITFREEPSVYVRLVTNVLPKEFVFENVTSELDDEQIDELIGAIKDRLLEARRKKPMLTVNAVESVTNGH